MILKLVSFLLLLQSVSSRDEEMMLKNELMENYDVTTIPKLKDMDPIELKLGVAIRAFEDIDQVEGTVLSNIWLRYYWNDYRLKWNSSYWNTSRIIFNSDPEIDNLIWTPDIYLYNTAELPMEQLKHSRAIVYSTGDIIWSRPGLIKSTCKFDLSYYPFDIQKCHMRFGSWVYSGNDLDLQIHESKMDISNMQLNEEWRLINTTVKRNTKVYACCPEEYIDLLFEYTLKRYSQHYTTNIIIPTIATSSLMLISLIVPWESGERISFVTTVMLSIIVFLLILSENLPKSDAYPFLSQLILGLTLFSLVSVFFTVIISSLYTHKKNRGIIYRLLELLKLRKKTECTKTDSTSTISGSNKSNFYEEEMRFVETAIDNETKIIDENLDVIDVDTVLESQLKKKNKNYISDDNKSAQTIVSGEFDCEETAGNVEAIFTLIFFLSFVIYLIYMFAIIP